MKRTIALMLVGVMFVLGCGSGSADLVRIQGGTFTMGSPTNEAGRWDDEGPQHQVTVSGFSMSKTEVTQAQWRELMGTTIQEQRDKSDWSSLYGEGDNYPMYYVSWHEAVEYCNARSKKEGLTPAYTISGDNVSWNRSANGYRLPTEAEWEYACRAGTTTPFSTGSNISTSQANYDGNYPYNGNSKGTYREATTAVGSFAPNSWGLYDMHGNVWEWCWDWFGDYSSASQTDPLGAASGPNCVFRSGSWINYAANLRSAYRNCYTPTSRDCDLGFRVVRP
ncbi:formylglycine-generating enzyme family protein [Breznakiellaceae bacterium SP9]